MRLLFRWQWLVPLLLLSMARAGAANSEALLKAGHADEALRALNYEVEANPSDAAAYNRLCRVYYQLELWDTALRMAERAVALEPGSSLYHQWVGRAAGRKAEVSNPFTAFTLARKVKNEFERSVALDGNNISARADLAEYYLEAPGFLGGDKNKARREAEAVAPHNPALAAYIKARVDEKKGNGLAEAQFKQAVTAGGDSARYWIELAHYYKRASRLNDMESAVNRSLTAARQDGVPEFDGAYLLLESGRNFPGAIQMLRRYIAGDGPCEDGPTFQAHYLLGKILEKQGDRQGAAEEFRAALALASQFRPARDALAHVSR